MSTRAFSVSALFVEFWVLINHFSNVSFFMMCLSLIVNMASFSLALAPVPCPQPSAFNHRAWALCCTASSSVLETMARLLKEFLSFCAAVECLQQWCSSNQAMITMSLTSWRGQTFRLFEWLFDQNYVGLLLQPLPLLPKDCNLPPL